MDKEQRTWSANVIKGICILQYSSKNIPCEELCIYIGCVPEPTYNSASVIYLFFFFGAVLCMCEGTTVCSLSWLIRDVVLACYGYMVTPYGNIVWK